MFNFYFQTTCPLFLVVGSLPQLPILAVGVPSQLLGVVGCRFAQGMLGHASSVVSQFTRGNQGWCFVLIGICWFYSGILSMWILNMVWYVWCLMDCSCRVFFVEHHCYIVGFLKISFAIFRQKALWILHKLSWLFILRWNVQSFWSHAFTGTPLERHAFQAHRSRLYGRACSGCCDCLSDIALIATALNCWRVALCQQDWDGSSH